MAWRVPVINSQDLADHDKKILWEGNQFVILTAVMLSEVDYVLLYSVASSPSFPLLTFLPFISPVLQVQFLVMQLFLYLIVVQLAITCAFNVYIDGSAGTTGLQVRDRLSGRKDVNIISIPDELRKDESARKEVSDLAGRGGFLCVSVLLSARKLHYTASTPPNPPPYPNPAAPLSSWRRPTP